MAHSKAKKLKSSGDKAISLFQAILNGKLVGQIFACMDSTVGFI
jgi:hypothetical protein